MNPILSLNAFWLHLEDAPSENRAAIVFELAPQWHIYWENYGDTGMSTTIDKGILRYPTPTRISLPGDLLSYGYENRVVFFVQQAEPNTTIRWLACKDDMCIPGSKELFFQQETTSKFHDLWYGLPKSCSFDWTHTDDVMSHVPGTSDSWMAPFLDVSRFVHTQSKQKNKHHIQWNTHHPHGRFLWVSTEFSCIVHIKK